MAIYPQTIVLRHRKENRKKCSLRGLESREDFQFFSYPNESLPLLEGYILLDIDGEALSKKDQDLGLFLLDATWRYADRMYKQISPEQMKKFHKRSLPHHLRTAYPRRQDDCSDPSRGLASVEALAAAYAIMGRESESLLESYHWKEDFLRLNSELFI
jgi:pre-rRNA-processing protein TSR3